MLILLLGLYSITFSQKHANYWMFGTGAALDFNCSPPKVFKVTNTSFNKGIASISDKCGNLRMYTDGDSIWHFAHFAYQDTVFPLNGSRDATQSSLILPSKSTPDKYYLFSVDDTFVNQFGLSYHEIENAGNGGPGFFPHGQANRVLSQGINEMITAVDHSNGEDYWVVVKMKNQSEFRSYLVSDGAGGSGVDTDFVSSPVGRTFDESGQMKLSPDGRFLAIANPLQIFNFDNSTGEITEYLDFADVGYIRDGQRESIEFSPSGNKLFFANYGFSGTAYGQNNVWQINLEETDFTMLKATIIGGTPPFEPKGGMQLGPDGKIYIIETSGARRLSVINSPELIADDMDFVRDAIDLPELPSITRAGLFFPTFNQSYFASSVPFKESFVCSNDSTLFEVNPEGWIDEIDGAKIDSVFWEFGDGTTSREEKPKHKYPAFGCYSVTLRIFSAGNGFEKTRDVKINISPTLDLGPRDTSLCVRPRLMTLQASSTDNAGASYAWYYNELGAPQGDPEGESGTNPKFPFDFADYHTADREGTYWVKKSWECCTSWDSITIQWDSIIPRFIVNDNLQCLEDNDFVFTNTSVPTIKTGTTNWDFGIGGKKTGEVAKVSYNQNGAFYPTMTTETEKGCKGKLTRIILVVKHPVARFFVDTTELCFKGNVFSIRDSSTIEYGQGGLQKWDYDLGDNTSTTQKQFTKKYNKAGSYDIRLIISSSQDCRDTITKTVRIYDQPSAGFSIDDTSQCLSANDFNFFDTSKSLTDPINLRHWTYGDGTPIDDRTGQPLGFNRNYGTVDSFLVTLKVGTGIGCFDTAKKYVYVHGDPFVDFAINEVEQCVDGNLYNFTDTTFTEKGFVQTKIWDFGDGSPIANNGLNKSYSNFGAYSVQLRVLTNKGCTDSISKTILLNPKPQAAFTIDKTITCFKDHSFTFSAAPSFIPVGTIDTYNWDFGDGTNDNLKDPLPKVYGVDGSKKILLTLTSNKGCIDSTQRVVQFYPTPVADASTIDDETQCLEDNLFTFTANGSTANGGNIKEYLWQLGDGTIEFGPNPPGKFYIDPDTFTVLLQITTDDNCTDTASFNVHTLPSPIANFSVDPTCLFQPSVFVNKSSSTPGFITNWNWNLGDGTSTTDSVPTHTYDNTGNYTISLNVLSNFGCEAKATKVNEAEVKPLPQARFSTEKIDFDAKNTTIRFVDSSIDAIQWYWDLGNGNLSTSQNPEVLYTDTVTLPVTLIISNAKGCYDTIMKSVFVAPDFFFHVPNAFTPNRDPLNPSYGGEGTLYYKEYNLKIFSRWGQKVFEGESPLERWDGTFKGKDCIEGQYTYVYRLRDIYGFYHNYKGVLTMFR